MTTGRVANQVVNQVVSRVPRNRLEMILAVIAQVANPWLAAKTPQRLVTAVRAGDEEDVDSASRWGFLNPKIDLVLTNCEAIHRVSER